MKFSYLLISFIQLTTSSPAHSTIEQRDFTLLASSDPSGAVVNTIFKDAANAFCDMVAKALDAVPDDVGRNLYYVFGDGSEAAQELVSSYLLDIFDYCADHVGSPDIYIWPDENSYVNAGGDGPIPGCAYPDATVPTPYLAWGDSMSNIVLCESFYTAAPYPTTCWGPSTGTYLVRELLLKPSVTNTGPSGTPGSFNDEGTFGADFPPRRLRFICFKRLARMFFRSTAQ